MRSCLVSTLAKLSMKVLLPLLFLIGFSSPALADFQCKDLLGTWASDRYDQTTSSENRTIKALNADGSYWIKFVRNNGDTVSTQKESGTWTCTDGIIGIKINAINNHQVNFYNEYRLVKPSAYFHSLKPIAPDCTSVIGDCSSDMLLEYYRVMS